MIDLHIHSTFSDGVLTPTELAKQIADIGLTAAALTDHDMVDGCNEFANAAKNYGVITINGCELSAAYAEVNMEVVALDIPQKNMPYFQDWQNDLIAERKRVAKERVNKLNELGIMVDWQKVAFDENGNPRKQIVKPHIVAEMLRLGYIKDWDEGFVKFLNKGAPAYVHRKEPEAKDVIEFVLDNGAVPILAHPIHTKLKGKELFEFLQKMKKWGLKGAEVFHSDHNANLKKQYLTMIEELEMISGGGSDFHGGAHPEVKLGSGKGDLKIPEIVLETIVARGNPTRAYYDELAKYI